MSNSIQIERPRERREFIWVAGWIIGLIVAGYSLVALSGYWNSIIGLAFSIYMIGWAYTWPKNLSFRRLFIGFNIVLMIVDIVLLVSW